MHLLSSLGGGGKNFRKVFVCVWGGGKGGLGVSEIFILVEGGVISLGAGGGGGGSCNFEVKLNVHNTSIKSIFGIT